MKMDNAYALLVVAIMKMVYVPNALLIIVINAKHQDLRNVFHAFILQL